MWFITNGDRGKEITRYKLCVTKTFYYAQLLSYSDLDATNQQFGNSGLKYQRTKAQISLFYSQETMNASCVVGHVIIIFVFMFCCTSKDAHIPSRTKQSIKKKCQTKRIAATMYLQAFRLARHRLPCAALFHGDGEDDEVDTA